MCRGVTPFGPPMCQSEADTELTLSASLTRAVGQKALAWPKALFHGSTLFLEVVREELWRCPKCRNPAEEA